MRRLPAVLVLPLLLLAACGDDGGGAGSGGGALDGVTVTGSAGKAPKVKVEEGFSVDRTTTEVVSQGDGPAVSQGATVLVNYVALNAKTGETFDNSYSSGQPQTFTLAQQQIFPGIIDALVGKRAGDRVAAAIPPSGLFGQQGNPQAKIGPTDTVVFVFDIEKASDPDPLEQVEGKSGPLPAALPQLQLDPDGTPTGFKASGSTEAAPDQLHVHTLVKGDGPEVQPGDLLTVHYLGQIYPDGKIFDQSYTRGAPTTFQVGVGSLIPAWDTGLVGIRKGSRVALAVPPDQGYGEQGQPSAGIKGDDTLMFVVDILGVS